MKLKQILMCSLMASAFVACDKIAESERTIGPLEFAARKCILIEDFTGQNCPNCPKAADEVHKLQELYGADSVIAVAIHGGQLSIHESKKGLATDWGNEYVKYWQAESFPIGLIDQVGGLFDYPKWGARTYERLQLTSPVELVIENQYKADTRTLDITVTAKAGEAYEGNIQVWLIENKIVTLQTMPDGKMNGKYEHNHVFRKAIFNESGDVDADKNISLHGEPIQIAAGKEKELTYSAELAEKWVAENMQVVAFVRNSDGVTQASICSVIKTETE